MFQTPRRYSVNPMETQALFEQSDQPGQAFEQSDLAKTQTRSKASETMKNDDKIKVVVKGVKHGVDLHKHLKVSVKGTTVMKLSQLCSLQDDCSDEMIVDQLGSRIRQLLCIVQDEWGKNMERQQEPEKVKYLVKRTIRPVGGGPAFEQEFITEDPDEFLRSQGQRLEGMGLKRKEGYDNLGQLMHGSTGATQQMAQM
jgi:hypothetical protein